MLSKLRIDNRKTAHLLEQARKARNLNQSELAKAIDLNQGQVNRILLAKFVRASKGMNALCAYLDVKPVMRKGVKSLAEYPDLATCLSDVLDGTKRRTRAVVSLLKSARKLA
jgi:transcriptional regulator with XRE-family HTH domain